MDDSNKSESSPPKRLWVQTEQDPGKTQSQSVPLPVKKAKANSTVELSSWGVDSYLGITVHFANDKEKRHQSLRIGLYLPYLYVNHFHRFLFSLLPVQLCPQRESNCWEAPGDSQKVLHWPSTASLTLPSIWSEVAFSCLIAFTGN